MEKKKFLMKYVGKIPCKIIRLGEFKPNGVYEIPESFAMGLARDRNWKLLEPALGKKEKKGGK